MNLQNCTVKHELFGNGTVIWKTRTSVCVRFPTGENVFQYPEAFEKFLKCEDEHLQEKVLAVATKKREKRELSGLQIASLILLGWTILLFIMGIAANNSPDTYSPNNLYPGITFAIGTVIVFILSLATQKRKDGPRREGNYRGKQINAKTQTRREYYYKKYGVDVCNIYYINGQHLGDYSAIEFMDGHTFEFFCADLLKDLGFTSVDVTPGSGDQGADILAVKGGERYAIQCKHRDDPFGVKYGNKPIQEVYTGMSFYKCNRGSVMTNGYFSKGGQRAAAATGVTLWDRDALMKMLKFAGFEQGQDRLCKREAAVVLPENKGRMTENINCYINRPIGNDTKDGTYEGILVHIDNKSFAHFGIAVTDISIDRESDTDEVELLFDVVSRNAPRRDIAIDIVCNIYGAGKKLATETDMIDFEKFRGRDSISILFDKKNISQIADRIEMYCKEW